MSIGDMKPIILERWGQTTTGTGSIDDAMTNRYKLWAEVKYDSGNRSYDGGQTKVQASYTFRIRFNNLNPNALYKIIYNGHRYTIHTIRRVNEKRFNYEVKTEADV